MGLRLGTVRSLGLAMGAALFSASCETTNPYPSGSETISIPYDPYNFDPDELFEQATAHCSAFGLRAVYVDETIDPQSVRWRYRHYSCV